MFAERKIYSDIRQNLSWYPIVSISGPRQAGKSTLLKQSFPDYQYFNLEDADIYRVVRDDPHNFLKSHSNKVILDEVQRVPDIFHSLQALSDMSEETGQFIISGSQNYLLLNSVTQSLAGRVGLINLYPFEYSEIKSIQNDATLQHVILKGGYPRLYNNMISQTRYFDDYINTYLGRDIEGVIRQSSWSDFVRFLYLCADCAGGLLNLSRLANDVGISFNTCKSWLSLLQASHIIYLLNPHYVNIRKRVTKTPKIYFIDNGLLCYLLNIRNIDELSLSRYAGAVYENFVVSETLKHYTNRGIKPRLSFYRDDSKREIDLIDETDPIKTRWIEIKSGSSYKSSYARHLNSVVDEIGNKGDSKIVVCNSSVNSVVGDIEVLNFETYVTKTLASEEN